MNVSEKIFLVMKQKGLSQIEFSRATGIAQSTISDWKHKGTNPTVKHIPIICKVLEISADSLFSIRPKVHIDYTTINENGELAGVRGELFNSGSYNYSTQSLMVWKDDCAFKINNVVEIEICGE